MVPVFWHRFGSRNGGTTKCNPTVCFISLPPISGNQKRTRFLEPTSVFWEPFFPISELLEWPARGQQNNLKQLAVFSLSTRCFRDDLKLS